MKILIAYDGSECADEAIYDLRRAGLPGDAEAVVECVADVVWPILPGTRDQPATADAPSAPADGDAAERALDSARHARAQALRLAERGGERVLHAFPRWSVVPEARAESPAWGLVSKAEEWKPDLLVVGSHGRNLVSRMIMGSVSQTVVCHAPCPVRVGRCPPGRPTQPAAVRLIVGIDGSAESLAAADFAARRTWPAGSATMVMGVVDTPLLSVVSPVASDPRYGSPEAAHHGPRDWLRRAVNEAAERLAESGLHVTPLLTEGDPKRVLLNAAESWGADCVFVGARGLRRVDRFLLGSVSASLAARAPCSVEVVRNVVPSPAARAGGDRPA